MAFIFQLWCLKPKLNQFKTCELVLKVSCQQTMSRLGHKQNSELNSNFSVYLKDKLNELISRLNSKAKDFQHQIDLKLYFWLFVMFSALNL